MRALLKKAFPIIALICWAFLAALASAAEARRIALVIGNADYKTGPLQNPVNDAAAVAEAFERNLGFDKVILKRNLTFNGFRAALDELARAASGANIAVLYFAGHGMEVGGKNYLIPVDATLARAGSLDLEALPLEIVLGQLDGVRELRLVILDACRNNPFVVHGGKRSQGRGLASIEPEDSTLVVYAAKAGTTADDGSGRPHSPFTDALLKHIATPDTEVRILLGRIGDEVASVTGRQQQPHVYGTLGGKEYYLQPRTKAPPSTAVTPPSSLALQLSEAERAWALVKGSTSIAVIEAFRLQYGAVNALFDRLAVERIEALRAEAKLNEQAKTEAKLKAEVKQAEEQAKAEAKMKADEKFKAEEKLKVAIAAPQAVAPPAPVPPDVVRQLQTELKRVGCDPGAIDGKWGDKGEAALERFARYSKLALAFDAPTTAILDAVKGQRGRVCPLECGPDAVEQNGHCLTKQAPVTPKAVVAPKGAPYAAPKPSPPPKKDGSKSETCNHRPPSTNWPVSVDIPCLKRYP